MSKEKQSFIDTYKDAAIRACEGTALFPSVMMAQGLLESGFGKSKLAAKYNNFFGIKANSAWTGQKVYLKNGANDPNKYSYYRVYPSAEASFRDRVKFLQENPRYTKNGVFSAKTPREQIQAMKNAGYAEDLNYVAKIMREISDYGLTALDNTPSPQSNIEPTGEDSSNLDSGKIIGGLTITFGLMILIKNFT